VNGSALLPSYRPQRWNSRGLTPVQERIFNAAAALVILAMIAGWVISFIDIRTQPVRTITVATPTGPQTVTVAPESRASTRVTSALLDPRTRTTAYVSDAALHFLDPVRGHSGKLKAAFRTPGAPLAGEAEENVTALFESKGGDSVVSPDLEAPTSPGIYKIAVQIDQARRAVDDISLITLVPFSQKKGGRIGLYYLGSWPYEKGGTPRSKAYGNPVGFIEVTRDNQNTYVSEHFRLRDFLTKDQPNQWPKYLLLDPQLLDKLELIIADLNSHGYNVKHMTVMSGFRTPRYNHSGGNTAGRANLSRHMYGDAADVYVDNDRDGWTDDVDGNGKVDVKDAEIVAAAAERVTRKYPALTGGIGIYTACCGHGPFVHVDIRGYAARWRGSGNG
jgi:uncharacterized protein YcbK (DUF882 family)